MSSGHLPITGPVSITGSTTTVGVTQTYVDEQDAAIRGGAEPSVTLETLRVSINSAPGGGDVTRAELASNTGSVVIAGGVF